MAGLRFGSEDLFHRNVAKNLSNSVETVTNTFIWNCRAQIINKNDVHLIVDARWSHSGWWANECTIIGVDAQTNLPIAVFHVIRNTNYMGSSRGKL